MHNICVGYVRLLSEHDGPSVEGMRGSVWRMLVFQYVIVLEVDYS